MVAAGDENPWLSWPWLSGAALVLPGTSVMFCHQVELRKVKSASLGSVRRRQRNIMAPFGRHSLLVCSLPDSPGCRVGLLG